MIHNKFITISTTNMFNNDHNISLAAQILSLPTLTSILTLMIMIYRKMDSIFQMLLSDLIFGAFFARHNHKGHDFSLPKEVQWVRSQSNEPTVMKDSRTAVLFMVIFIFSYRGLLR
jgi:hypothetical protein